MGIIGAAGIAGGELVRLLERHPNVRIAGLQGRDRDHEPLAPSQPQLGRTGHYIETSLPRGGRGLHGPAPRGLGRPGPRLSSSEGIAVIDLGSDYRLSDPADYERWYDYTHPYPELLAMSVYGLPEQHRAELQALQGCRRHPGGLTGLLPHDLDDGPLSAGAGRPHRGCRGRCQERRLGRRPLGQAPTLMYSEVNDSVKAYGVGGHRHTAELVQEIRDAGPTPEANPGAATVGFQPHLVPMNRGILAAGHVRPTRPVTPDRAGASSTTEAYEDEYFVEVVEQAPATGHVRGSNFVRVYAHFDERTGRITTISVEDNLVKGAAGQAVQAFNIVFGLPESAGLEQLPTRPVTALAPLPSDLPEVEVEARLPRGFRALGTSAGIKESGALDLAVVLVRRTAPRRSPRPSPPTACRRRAVQHEQGAPRRHRARR